MGKYISLFVGRTVLKVAGIKLNIHYVGNRPSRPVIYIFNHSSTLDLFILLSLGLDNIRFVAKREFQLNPFFLILGNLTGQIFIERGNSKRSLLKLKRSYERIKRRNLSVVMGPEGSRKHEGIIGPFKKGAFFMAKDLGYPVVPMYFDKAYTLCYGQSIVTKKGTVNVYIHPEIETTNWKREEVIYHMKSIREKYLEWAGVVEASD